MTLWPTAHAHSSCLCHPWEPLGTRTEVAWPMGLGRWTLASPPQAALGCFLLLGNYIAHSPARTALRRALCLYRRELGMGEVHPNSSLWIVGIKKEGHSSILQSCEHHRSLPQAHPANKSRGAESRVVWQGLLRVGGSGAAAGQLQSVVQSAVTAREGSRWAHGVSLLWRWHQHG